MIHTVTLNPVVDLIYHVPNFKKGTTFRSSDFRMVPAGKGINVSYSLSCLEEPSSTYMVLNEECLPMYQRACEEHEITFYSVTGALQMRYHTTLLDQHDRTVTHIQTKGDPVSPQFVDQLIDVLINRLSRQDIVLLSGSVPPGIDPSIYAMITEECKNYETVVILDTSGDSLVEGIQAKPFMVKINQKEAEELADQSIQSLDDGVQVIKKIHDLSFVPVVVVTLGADGMLAGTPKGIWKFSLPMKEKEIVDTVGCGDAMAAGLAYGLSRNRAEEDLFQYAIACASAAARHAGPSHFQKTELKSLIDRVRIQRLASL